MNSANPFLLDWSIETEPVDPVFEPYTPTVNSQNFVGHSVPDNLTYVLKTPQSFDQSITHQTTSTNESPQQSVRIPNTLETPPLHYSTRVPSTLESHQQYYMQTPRVSQPHFQQIANKPKSTPQVSTQITSEPKSSQLSINLESQQGLHQHQHQQNNECRQSGIIATASND